MKKIFAVAVSLIAILSALWAIDAVAAAYPTGVGGTGTTAAPAAGQVLIGTGNGAYTPAYLLCAGTCSISSASGTITITGTGVSTTTGNWQGTWQLYNPSDFLTSSTQVVNTVNGGSGTVTITSSTLGVVWPTVNGNQSAAYHITATNGATSTVSGATTTISVNLNNGSAVTCSANQFLDTISATGTAQCGSITFPTIPTYTFSSGTGISFSQSTSTSNTTTTVTNTGVTSFTGQGCVTAANSTGSVALAVSCISGNQSILFTIAGDATGTASGTTAITDTVTVIGLNGKALPANTTGTLQYSQGAWAINLATSSLGVYDANGKLSSYLGSACTGGQYVTGFSATGTVACGTPSSAVPSPLTVGGTQSSTITGDGTTSTIPNFDTILDAATFPGADMGAKINAAYAALPTYGGEITVPAGDWSYTTPIVMTTANKTVMLSCPSGGGFYTAGGATLQYTGATGTAIHIDTNSFASAGVGISNCHFIGPAGIAGAPSPSLNTTSTIGIDLGGTVRGTFGYQLDNVAVSGFGTGVYLDENTSFVTISNSVINENIQNLIEPNLSGANGENMRLTNDVFADSHASSTNISNKCVELDYGGMDWQISGTSFDDCQLYIGADTANSATVGEVHLTNNHFERPNTGIGNYPFIVSITGNHAVVQVVSVGNEFVYNGAGSATGTLAIVQNGGQFQSFGDGVTLYTPNTTETIQFANPLDGQAVTQWSGLVAHGFYDSTMVLNLVGSQTFTPQGFEVGTTTPVNVISSTTSTVPSVGVGIVSSPFLGTDSNGYATSVSTSTLKSYTDTFGYATSSGGGASSTVSLTASSTANAFTYWLNSNGTLSSSSQITVSGNQIRIGNSLNPTSTELLNLGSNTNTSTYGIGVTGGRLMLGFDATNANAYLAGGDAKGLEFFTSSTNDTFPTGTPVLVISAAGYVGIGTSTPSLPGLTTYCSSSYCYNFLQSGTTTGYTSINNTYNTMNVGTQSSSSLEFNTNNTPADFIDSAGNFHIGSSTTVLLYPDPNDDGYLDVQEDGTGGNGQQTILQLYPPSDNGAEESTFTAKICDTTPSGTLITSACLGDDSGIENYNETNTSTVNGGVDNYMYLDEYNSTSSASLVPFLLRFWHSYLGNVNNASATTIDFAINPNNQGSLYFGNFSTSTIANSTTSAMNFMGNTSQTYAILVMENGATSSPIYKLDNTGDITSYGINRIYPNGSSSAYLDIQTLQSGVGVELFCYLSTYAPCDFEGNPLTFNELSGDPVKFGSATTTAPTTFYGNLTQSSGTVSLASTTVNGNVTSTTQNITGTSTATSYQDITSSTPSYLSNLDSYQYAAAVLPSGFSEYGAYLNQLCTSNASGTTIYIPQGTFNVSTTLNITQRCTYIGVGGNGTILQWVGAQGGTIVNENWGDQVNSDGGGLKNLTLYGNSATTTNPTICLLQGGNAGARTANNDGLTITNCGIGYNTASNTYMSILSNSSIDANGQNVLINSANNSGESMNWFNVKVVDPANASATNCFYVQNNGLENGLWSGGSQDDCGAYFGNGNNMVYVGVNFENPGYSTYGRYTYINETSSFFGTSVTVDGGNMQNDSVASATAPAFYVNIGGNFYGNNIEFAKGSGSAYEVPEAITNTNSNANGIATMCNNMIQNNSGNALTSIFSTGNTTNAENNGCLTLNANDYINGYDVTTGGTNWYQAGGVEAALSQKGFGESILTYTGTQLGFNTSTAVTVSSCGSGSPSLNGSDQGGIVTIGTGGITSCKVNFSPSWSFTPVCTVSDSSSTDAADVNALSTSSLTIGFPVSLTAGTAYYICQGNPN